MMLVKLLLVAFFFFHEIAAQCGPPQCYSGCTDARPQVDFVFLVDVSGSMQPKIDGVKNGLTTFANSLDSNSISPKFSIVKFGASNAVPSLYQDMTDFATFKTSMSKITTNGGQECGLEAIDVSLGTASTGNLGVSFRTGENTKKVFILVTDEDSDQSTKSANIFSTGSYTQAGAALDGLCYSSMSSALWEGAWQKEINYVANSLISADASLYMFVLATACKTPYQYCNPNLQSQSSDYKSFDANVTLTNLKSYSQERSLQGQLLTAGITSRCFGVADTGSTTLVNNFFSEIVSDITKCKDCYSYQCSGSSCLAPTYICDCAGTPNGSKVTDVNGACCLASALDCAGVCNGNSDYDSCGVCTANGALYSACKQDCNYNYYLDLPSNPTALAAYSSLVYKTTCPNLAGYLIPNTDIIALYKSTGNQSTICTHFHQYGRFEGRTQCTLNLTRYNNDYVTAFTQTTAEADYLAKLLTSSPRTAYCATGSRVKTPPLSTDSCGQCIVYLDNPPYCVQDCHGVYRKQSESPYFTDLCGYCVAPGTNTSAHKDDCGVCDGNNANKNECGVCNGVRGLDGCNQTACSNLTCTIECDGVSRNPTEMTVDVCGYCVNKTLGRDSRCVQDCAGVYYKNVNSTSSPSIVDECGNCVIRANVRLSTCVQDCNGTWAGTAYNDSCGQCVVGGVSAYTCSQDCNGNYYREGKDTKIYSIDDCGFCTTSATANADKDACGICKSKVGYNSTAQCTADCKGIFRLIDSADRAFQDFCLTCWFANQTEMTNYYLDECGICWPSRDDPSWNKTTNGQDSQGVACACTVQATLCADNVTTTCSDNCPETNWCPGTTESPDSCGRCKGNTTYYDHALDDCGMCCDPDNGVPCNQDKDDCGVCFGFNIDKQNECGICLNSNFPSNTCTQDCLGNYNGNATYGCDGVCNSNATCSTCGNGIKEAGETCDLGTDPATNSSLNVAGSGCSPNCVAEAGKNTGTIVGGVIGGVAAVAFLGLAAFLAVKYAQKNGLIGSANKNVDMGASNTNPLYQSEVAVHQNPLYETS